MPDPVIPDRGAENTKVEEAAIAETAFDDAFKEAASIGEPADIHAADDPAKMEEEKPVETPPVKAEVASPVEIPPASEQQPGESDEKYEQRYKTLQGIHKHDKETWEAEKAKLIKDLEAAKKPVAPEAPVVPPTPAEAAAAEAFIDSLTDEQKEQLKEYEQDFDVVSKMEGIKRKVELGKLRKEMQEEIQKWKDDFTTQLTTTKTELSTRIAPAIERAELDERDSHFNLIREGYTREDGTVVPGHPDFEKFRDDGSLVKWIESKPKYLQPALKKAYEGGTAEDVIDLYADFKRDSNIPIETPEPSSSNIVNLDTRKAERKEALRSVPSRKSAVAASAAAPAQDFDAAFDEALNRK